MSKYQQFLQYSIVLLVSFGCSLIYAPQMLPPAMMGGMQAVQTVQEDSPELLEWHEVLKTTITLLTKIDAIIEDILIMFHKGVIRLKNDRVAEDIIREIRQNVMGILHDQTNFLRVKKVEDLKRYCAHLKILIEALTDHLDTIVDSGFKQVKPFNFGLLQKRKINTNISIASLKKELITLNKQITELHEKEEYSNLAWYNILSRKFEKNIIIPWYQYKLGTVAKVAFMTTATTVVLLWQLGSVHRQNQEQFELRNFVEHFGYNELIKKYSYIKRKYNFNLSLDFEILEKGELRNVLDQRGVFSTRDPFRGRPHESTNAAKYLSQADVNFIEAAFKEYLNEVLKKSRLSRFLSVVPNMLGLTYPVSPYGGGIDYDQQAKNADKYSFGSTLLYLADSVAKGQYAMLGLVGSLAWGTYKEVWGDGMPGSFQAWITEKGFDLWNFLRGGAHLQQTMSLDFNPTLTFDDVIGMDEVKEELKFLLSFIENPEMFIRSGKIPERGYLLTGPTRSGKSFIVEALCGEINKRLRALGRSKEFKFRKIPPFLITNAGVERILMWAKSEAPIILWIDEIDLLDLQRVGDKKTLMAFLTGMGNSFDNDPNKLVIIIGCTNRPQNMDFALKQYGRFGKEIRFEYPSAEYRRKFIVKQLQSMGLDPRYFDIESLTYKTEGCHFEQIKAFIKGASVKAWMYGKVIDQELLDECFDIEIRHILPVERKVLSETEREILATYFAGKALAHALFDTRGQLDRVTIRPIMVKLEETWVYEELTDKEKQAKGDDHKIQYGQVFTKHLNDTAKINTYEQALNEIKIFEAGFAAEEVMFGVSTYSCHPEESMHAYKAAESIAFEGLDRCRIGKKQLEKLTEKSYLLKKQCHEEVKKLLEEYKPALEALIKALKKDATLSDNQVMAIIEQAMTEQEEKEMDEHVDEGASEPKEELVPDVQQEDVIQ